MANFRISRILDIIYRKHPDSITIREKQMAHYKKTASIIRKAAFTIIIFCLSYEAKSIEFTTEQICKAGIASMYKRDPKTIKTTTLSENIVKIEYQRPQDKKMFSYKCRLVDNSIQTYDTSLNGARWYGSEPSDSKLMYLKKNDRLIIRDIFNENIQEYYYSVNDLSDKN